MQPVIFTAISYGEITKFAISQSEARSMILWHCVSDLIWLDMVNIPTCNSTFLVGFEFDWQWNCCVVVQQVCESGSNSTAGSISCSPCPAGYDCTSSPGNVTLCTAGTYSNYGEGICHSCPSGKVCPDPSQQPQVHFFMWVLLISFCHHTVAGQVRTAGTIKK